MEEVIIIGNGISGLTAGIYTVRANLKPLIFGGKQPGGQLTLTTDVENFPGFPDGVQGPDLVMQAEQQAKRFGARVEYIEVTSFKPEKDHISLETNDGKKYSSKAVIIATGSRARMLGLESEEKYFAKGLHTCAVCDGAFYRNKHVLVVGGGDSACEESLFLSKLAEKVTLVHRRDTLRASKIMQEKVKANKKIQIKWNTELKDLLGESQLEKVLLYNNKTNKEETFTVDGVFLAIGHIPNTDVFKGKINLDDHGYVKTNDKLETSVAGVFAAGDVQDPFYRQAITAAGTGCQAAMEVEKYLERK